MKEKLKAVWKVIVALYNLFVYPVLMILGLMWWFHEISDKLGWTRE